MNAAALVRLFQQAAYTVLESRAALVVGERAIPGHPGEFRHAVFTDDVGGWSGAMYRKRGGGLADPSPEYLGGVMHRSPLLDSIDEAALWLGGVSSVPVSRAEADAILRGARPLARAG